ncbi:hypothetical protein [Nocardia brevicatena]|nr:hypothetical protein [Nocardia brevicatena]
MQTADVVALVTRVASGSDADLARGTTAHGRRLRGIQSYRRSLR